MNSPAPLIAIMFIYLWFVLKAGPQYMRHREPFTLVTTIKVYNIFQVIACARFVKKFHALGFNFRFTWQCVNELKAGFEEETYNEMWWFLMLRSFELIETVFFVLRKRQKQVSALHVYHHLSTMVLLWLYLKYSAG